MPPEALLQLSIVIQLLAPSESTARAGELSQLSTSGAQGFSGTSVLQTAWQLLTVCFLIAQVKPLKPETSTEE